jgi:hypothetical protein
MPLDTQHALLAQLARPGVNFPALRDRVSRKPELMESVIAGLGSDQARVKLASSKLVMLLSESSPDLVYPHFGLLARQLQHDNSILRWNAALSLAHLAPVDREEKIARILDVYLAPIAGPNMIDAGNVMRGAAIIALAKPYLAGKIAEAILEVEAASYATIECRNVAIGHAIRAFEVFIRKIEDTRAVLAFVDSQTTNPRRATAAKAVRFLKMLPGRRARAAT